MKQRQLEMRLQKLKGFEEPKPELEQYATPAKIAADIIYTAHSHGDVSDKTIIDLGCGTGIFSVGCCLMGAGEVTGIDTDHAAIDRARDNADVPGCNVSFQCMPVELVTGRWDTCIMNPPFGSQKRHADLPFLNRAMEVAGTVYSLHNSETLKFLRMYIEREGWKITLEKAYKFPIPHTFGFHNKDREDIPATLLRMVKE